MTSPPRELLGIPQIANEWKVSRRTVERWLSNGLPFMLIEGRRFASRTDTKDWFGRIMAAEPEEKTRRRNRRKIG